MNYAAYYHNDISLTWRFSCLRSGQPAASERSLTGGKTALKASMANCRTPQ
jgi:hypothetical protein